MANKFFKLKGKTLAIIDWANVHGWASSLAWEIDPRKLYDFLNLHDEIYQINFYSGEEKGNLKSEDFQKIVSDIGYNTISKEVKWVPVNKNHFNKMVKNLFDVMDKVKLTNSDISAKLYALIRKLKRLMEDSFGVTKDSSYANSIFNEDLLKEIYDSISLMDEELKKINIDIEILQKDVQKPIMRRKCDFDVEITRDIFNEFNNFEVLILFSGDGDYAPLAEYVISKGKKAIVIFARGHKGKEYEDFKRGLFLCPIKRLKSFLK